MSGAEEDVDERISRTLFCKGLTQEVTQSIVYELFLIAGPIQCVHLPRARVCETAPLAKTKEGGTVPLGVAKAKEQASNNCEQNGNIAQSTGEREDKVGVVLKNKGRIAPIDNDPSAINRGVLFENCDNKEIKEQDALESLIEASGIDMDIMDCTKKVTNVTSVSDEKPFSVEEKILPRYKAGEHQGYAFIIFRHVQSVAYAMDIFVGTKLFGSQLCMSPALQAIQKMRQDSQTSPNCRNADKRKTETSYRYPMQERMPSALYASDIRNNRSFSNQYINVMRKGPNTFNDQRHLSYTDVEGMGQYDPPGYTNKRPIHGYGNMLSNSYFVKDSNMSQGNWRMRPGKNDCNVVEGSSTISGNHIVNYDSWHWRSKPSGSAADNILLNPRDGTNLHIHSGSIPQAGEIPNYSSPCQQPQKMSGFDRNSLLLARVAQLNFQKRERSETRDKPIIDSDSFLSLTLNPTPNDGSKASLHSSQMASTTSPAHKNSPPIKPLLRPLEIDSLSVRRPLNVSGDTQIPILHYEIDKQPDTNNFWNITYPDDSQSVSEIQDLHQPTIPSLFRAPMYQAHNISTDAQRIVDPMPDRQSKPGQHQDYSAYEHRAKLSDLRSYQSVQCLDADNPYAQSQQQQQCYHGSEFQPPYHYPVHQDNYFPHSNQPRPLFLGQFSRLSLDYDSNERPSAIYTRTFGPSSPRGRDELDVHRTRSAPSTLVPTTMDSQAKPSRSDVCVDEPLAGQWVSPVAWKAKRQNPTRVRNDMKVDRPSRNLNPQNVEQASMSPRHGASKKSERRHTMSECIDTAFAAYQQRGGASTTPRARPAAGGGASTSPRARPAAGGASPRRRV